MTHRLFVLIVPISSDPLEIGGYTPKAHSPYPPPTLLPPPPPSPARFRPPCRLNGLDHGRPAGGIAASAALPRGFLCHRVPSQFRLAGLARKNA